MDQFVAARLSALCPLSSATCYQSPDGLSLLIMTTEQSTQLKRNQATNDSSVVWFVAGCCFELVVHLLGSFSIQEVTRCSGILMSRMFHVRLHADLYMSL